MREEYVFVRNKDKKTFVVNAGFDESKSEEERTEEAWDLLYEKHGLTKQDAYLDDVLEV